MNTNISQIQQLTPEQQDALGSVVVKRDAIRQRLLKQRGYYWGMSWLPFLVMSLVGLLCLAQSVITNPIFSVIVVFCVGMSLWVLIQFHAYGVNRRIDALIEMMEDDHAA